ncbi:DUF916 domain-containing protein [Micromonospora tarensis]|uniref:DUF916 domain-containing protein n=1 Tax=Micromonospora tarensis TaxID=2806100 RepID=UPI001EE4734A|nr:DUF916 domain-containing protein [Micromonospora tarensis]
MTVTPLRRALVALAVVSLTVAAAPAAVAAEPDPKALTWTVQPASATGPDHRRWITANLDPGQAVTEHLAVRNLSRSAVAFSLKAADGYLTDKGRFNMLSSDRPSVDGGTWIDVQQRVTVGPNETRVVPFTITVPRDATPGDHPAGIAATVTSTGGTVSVESRVGFRVMLRVNGVARAALPVGGLSTSYSPSWNPFRAGTVRVRYTVENDGNVWVGGTSRVTVSDLFGRTSHDATGAVEELLPGAAARCGPGPTASGRWGVCVPQSPRHRPCSARVRPPPSCGWRPPPSPPGSCRGCSSYCSVSSPYCCSLCGR